MKKILTTAALAILVSTVAVSCKKKNNDADLQAKATAVVAVDPQVKVEVKDGVAHLSGTFKDTAAKDQMIASLKAIEGVKDVMDMSTVEAPAPVETKVASAPENLQKVKDALKDFPKVKAEVVNGELTISGDVTRDQAMKIKQSVDALKVGKVNYNYIVK
ncbi:BON domain-containing protein [Elizabethkingia meningoseptica]|uniref:BON domain-containing protein n=1 Tax=Elizabethkingia meningoseptica TaxID=238 RepID=UPI0023AFABA7|nr:BON domain-containing protein [Elizabethkingia meningoseptica]MDE5438609.1 BON domain-containing protein [Elizabethkingia meningoseptica]MDE5507680.1 BON domain-containing protein [Elizabethkingia meningoseptica]MDE5516470.1 BON domain-containing protein [Elizabethkingia meningoseptica]MDE5530721.1 BON domain-containing protein [Elizabethkingia meningoseptica]MDE5534278.1 BON domain-containing protein [Elizabethkingia meningoseptica]